MSGRVPSDTRSRIQAIALELLQTQGAQRTSLQQIADRLGVTKAALYYHFPSKASLIASLLQPFLDDINRFIDDAEASPLPPRELLTAWFDTLVPHLQVFRIVLFDASVLAYVDFQAMAVRWAERFQILLTGPDPTPEQRVRALVAAGGLTRGLLVDDIPLDRLRAAAIDAACGALGLDPPGDPDDRPRREGETRPRTRTSS